VPVPLAALVMVTHETAEAAVHGQPTGVNRETLPDVPPAPAVVLVGVSE
jgi:hypothetical protein